MGSASFPSAKLACQSMITASPIDLGQQDRLTYWLVRLSEALQRLNHCLLRAGASPGEFATILAGPNFEATSLALEIRVVAHAMRRFADMLPNQGPALRTDLPAWEELMASLKLMLSACSLESELWRGGRAGADPALLGEVSATVHAIEGLCRRFEPLH